jgi:hypothetical protein
MWRVEGDCGAIIPGAQASVAEAWVQVYQSLLLGDSLGELLELGYVCFGLDHHDRAVALVGRCEAVRVSVCQGFDAEYGHYAHLPEYGDPCSPVGDWGTRWRPLVDEQLQQATGLGHRPDGCAVGSRAAYSCFDCGGRLLIDGVHGLVYGELATGERCPDDTGVAGRPSGDTPTERPGQEAIAFTGTGTGLGPYIVAVPAASVASSAANSPVPNAPPTPSSKVNTACPDLDIFEMGDIRLNCG